MLAAGKDAAYVLWVASTKVVAVGSVVGKAEKSQVRPVPPGPGGW